MFRESSIVPRSRIIAIQRITLFTRQPAIVTPSAIMVPENALARGVRIAGVRSRAAQGAIVVQALLSVPAGGRAFGHTMAAAAVYRIWYGLELVHYSLAPL